MIEDTMHDDGKDGDEVRILREEAKDLERGAHKLEETAHGMEDRAHEIEELADKIEEEREHCHHDRGDGSGGDHHGGGDDHDHDHGHGHHHDAKVKLKVVVNGAATEVEASHDEALAAVRKQALDQTKNLAQPAENWEIKNEAGEVLDPTKTVGDYHLADGETLRLSRGAGVAGA